MAGKPWEKFQQQQSAQPTNQLLASNTMEVAGPKEPWKKFQAPKPPSGDVAISQPVAQQDEEPKTSTGEALLQGVGKGPLMGYLPYAQAGLGYAAEHGAAMIGGGKPESWKQQLDYFENRDKQISKDHPVAEKIGEGAGIIGTLPLMPGLTAAKGAGLLTRLGASAATGAGYGLAAAPEKGPGLLENPEANLKQRLDNALMGGALGGGLHGAVEGGVAAFPYVARATSGIPSRAIKYYRDNMGVVDKMIEDPRGYIPEVEAAQGKIDAARGQQQAKADAEFGIQVAQDHPTTVGPEGVEGRVMNIQQKINETKDSVDQAIANKASEAEQTAQQVADLNAKRQAVITQKTAAHRENLAQDLKTKLGSDDIEGSLVQRLKDRADELKQTFYQKKREVGSSIQNKLKETGGSVMNIDEVFQPIDEQIDKLMKSDLAKTPAGAQEIESLQALRKQISHGLPENINVDSALMLKDRLKLMSGAQRMPSGGYGARYSPEASVAEKAMQDAALNSYSRLNAKLDQVADTTGNRAAYRKMIQMEEVLDKDFSSPEQIMKSVQDLKGSKKVLMRDKINQVKELTDGKVDLSHDYDILSKYHELSLPDEKLLPQQQIEKIDKYFQNRTDAIKNYSQKNIDQQVSEMEKTKKLLDRHFGEPQKTAKTLEIAAKPGAHAGKQAVQDVSAMTGVDLGEQAKDIANFQKIGEKTAQFQKKPVVVGPESQKLSDMDKIIDRNFSSPEKTFKTLSGYDKPSKKFLQQNVDQASQMTGQDLGNTSRKLEAYSHFQDPSLLPISGEGTTSTSRSLGLSSAFRGAGSMLGLFGERAGKFGERVGEGVGQVLGGPASVKAALKAGKYMSEKGQRLAPNGPAPLFTPWLRMRGDNGQ